MEPSKVDGGMFASSAEDQGRRTFPSKPQKDDICMTGGRDQRRNVLPRCDSSHRSTPDSVDSNNCSASDKYQSRITLSKDESKHILPGTSSSRHIRRESCGDSSLKPNPRHDTSWSRLSNFKAKDVSKHYALNNQTLEAYDSLYQRKEFRGAYAFGIQYVEVALLEIPKHGYFYSKRHMHEREENSKTALRVISQLKDILKELKPEVKSSDWKSDWERLDLLHKLGIEQAASDQQIMNERDRRRIESELAQQKRTSFCGDIFEYIEMLCPASDIESSSSPDLNPVRSKPTQSALNPDNTEIRLSTQLDQLQTQDLRRSLLLSGVAASDNHEPKGRSRKSASEIDFQTLCKCYYDDFGELRNQGRVRISQASTYQGRHPGSINGCTVIAPLLFLHHFHNWDEGAVDHGLADAAICEVIDRETPSLLSEVRSNLGLSQNALIIPSDVHDFLINKQLLTSEQFVTVCGGDILDDAHLSHFVDELQHGNGSDTNYSGRKLAASFFFHEHVVAILKLQRSRTEAWYDLIDSLPKQETFRNRFEDIESNDGFILNTSRIRCIGAESLKGALRWYACSRFTEENRTYIDMYDWDDAYADYDPRVFQAYLWAGPEIMT
mmetsp:Transcript_16344/g.24942  ORF Transcript_16344/g.24942 Transcript_16344/m.24942 type:complete len:610 (-) Transcript_16344:358-2187(-)